MEQGVTSSAGRFWVSSLVVLMLGFWLNVAAVMIVATTNGAPGVPSPLLQVVYVAYWPSLLRGLPHDTWFYPDARPAFTSNAVGWLAAAVLTGAVAGIRRPCRQAQNP
jgi:hypothetical protein